MASDSNTCRITVRLTPRGGRDAVDGVADGVVRVRVAAAPTEGAANESLRRLLAERLGLAPSRIRVLRGGASRTKVLEIEGRESAEVFSALEAS